MNYYEVLKALKGLPVTDYRAMLFARKIKKGVTVSGVPCVLEKSVGKPVISYKIYGNTVEVQSVGNLITEGENSGKYEIPVVCRGKNLFDFLSVFDGNINSILDNGYYFVMFPGSKTILKSEFKKNTSYTLSFYGYGWASERSGIFRIKYTDGTLKEVVVLGAEPKMYTCTTAADKTVDSISITWGARPNTYIKDIMLEENSEVTSYEPYHEPVIMPVYINTPLENGDVLKYPGNVLLHSDGTEESVNLPDIPTFDGTTIIETDTQIQPKNIKITYKSRR